MNGQRSWYCLLCTFCFPLTSFAAAWVVSLSRVLTHFRGGDILPAQTFMSIFVIYSQRKEREEALKGLVLILLHPPFVLVVNGRGVTVWLDFEGENKMWEGQSMNVCFFCIHTTEKVSRCHDHKDSFADMADPWITQQHVCCSQY